MDHRSGVGRRRVLANQRTRRVVRQQHGEGRADAGLAFSAVGALGKGTSAGLRGNLAGVLGRYRQVSYRRHGGTDSGTFFNRSPGIVVVQHHRQRAGHCHIATAGAGHRPGSHGGEEVGTAVLLRRGADFDAASLCHRGTSTQRSVGDVARDAGGDGCGNAVVVGHRLAIGGRAVVGFGAGLDRQLAAGAHAATRADAGIGAVFCHAHADRCSHADLLAALLGSAFFVGVGVGCLGFGRRGVGGLRGIVAFGREVELRGLLFVDRGAILRITVGLLLLLGTLGAGHGRGLDRHARAGLHIDGGGTGHVPLNAGCHMVNHHCRRQRCPNRHVAGRLACRRVRHFIGRTRVHLQVTRERRAGERRADPCRGRVEGHGDSDDRRDGNLRAGGTSFDFGTGRVGRVCEYPHAGRVADDGTIIDHRARRVGHHIHAHRRADTCRRASGVNL